MKDVEDIPTSVLDEINIIPVNQVDEVFKLALK
jgi:ATP-dependent Lon protease